MFGQDPLSRPVSSKPAEVLAHCGVTGDVVVWDADNNEELAAGIRRAAAEQRVVVGAAGAIAAFAQSIAPTAATRSLQLKPPVLVVCGSLNPQSRAQLDRLSIAPQIEHYELGESDALTVWTTPAVNGEIEPAQALRVASDLAKATNQVWSKLNTLVVVGGDTVAAIVGDDTLDCIGSVAPGIPVSHYRGLDLVTKGGGIGPLDVFSDILP